MRHFKQYENEIFSLINENEYYIIFNDGKAIRSNVPDYVSIEVDNTFDCYDYCKRKRDEKEQSIIKNSIYSTYISINDHIDLKIIHLNDDVKEFNCTIEVASRKKVNICNIYQHIDIDYKILKEVILNEKSSLNYLNYCSCNSPLHEIMNVYLDGKASFVFNNMNLNLNEVDLVQNVYMNENGANAIVNNSIINVSSKEQKYDYNVYHHAPFTTSSMLNYCIANKGSTIHINSNGIIKKGCIKSSLDQKSKGILLDLNSDISANPLLMIDEYDVLASHGASIGSIDEKDLYYLMSRGLDRQMSEALIVQSYIVDYINHINDELVKKHINNKVSELL